MAAHADVFVSYKAEDRARVQPIVAALEAEGFIVWWDTRIEGGANWRRSIEEQLNAAKCVVVAWTKRSVGPEGEFVRDEAALAKRRGIYLPILLDPIEPPLGFREIQAISLRGWRKGVSDPCFRVLADAIRQCLTNGHVAGRSTSHERARISRRAVVTGGVGIGVLAASGAGVWLLSRPARANAKRIAVLPFANLSGDPAQAYFSDGMAEELRSALGRLGMQVIGRTSSDAVRDMDAKAAAAKLDVANILTGSVRRSPATIRVDAQLVSGKDGVEQWAQTYDRAPGDAIKIQTDIAENVAQALSIALGQAGQAALKLGGTTNAQAQDLLLQATAIESDDSSTGLLRRIALLESAMQVDPYYAEAFARKGMAQTLWANAWASSNAEKDRVSAEALGTIRRAIAIAPAMAFGYTALGVAYQYQLLMSRSLNALRQAVEHPGADVPTLCNYGLVLSQMLRQTEAESALERALALDPLNSVALQIQSTVFRNGRHYPEAIEAARRSLSIAPQYSRARYSLAEGLLQLDRTTEATRELQKMPSDDYRRLVTEGVIAARSQRKQDAFHAIALVEKHYGETANYQYAEIYAQLGEIDKSVDQLNLGLSVRDSGLSAMQVDPFLDPLRNDPRFSSIVKKIFA